ncbi:PLD nuclease N-terminal domain-containing protein [Actinotalea sp. K2]|uniref:PLD nuclease N-terminal domain-containing protein n=1 Tax=Actinotalea sp. K2 TaxID=2939438 RepID=UPI002016ECEE|nr:PLD nuclease N-terminal domain-containing protein [Actinotalea sp. K2]MCL3863053.1 PLD nuclease N-terminal domain-containing protein [Actinotalea sp. K2]
MLRALVYVVPLALAIYALIDLSRSEPFERVGIRRLVWVAIVVLLPVVGPIAWIAVSRNRRSTEGPRTGTPSGGRPRPTGPTRPGGRLPRRQESTAPDDDPDFLWRLEQQQRRRGQGPASPGAKPGDDVPPTDPSDPTEPTEDDNDTPPDTGATRG